MKKTHIIHNTLLDRPKGTIIFNEFTGKVGCIIGEEVEVLNVQPDDRCASRQRATLRRPNGQISWACASLLIPINT
jgi:hypothetical protein